ncbi:MAG: VWA domain-containing protein [Sphingomonadales bacterium]|nr:VWA domain-containing protein [Sphingomonadales bacterium]
MENTLPPKTLHYYLVADRSGSMSDQIQEVRYEINKHLLDLAGKAKESNTDIRMNLLVFNDSLDWIYAGQNLSEVMPLTCEQYHARGNTALFDAAGQAIEWASNAIQGPLDPEKEEVVVMIFSDGMENSSRQYNRERFKELVERYQNETGWTITFSGCDLAGIGQLQRAKWRNDRMLSYKYHEKARAMSDMAENMSSCVQDRGQFFKMNYKKRPIPGDADQK